MEDKNATLASELLPLMQKSGRLIADDKATTDSFAKHIQEITSLGYDGDIHSNFSRFICRNFSLATKDRVKWTSEILLDWIVLDTARCLTTKKYNYCLSRDIGEDKFISSLSFQPPDFNLNPHLYTGTEVARTFWKLPLGRVEDLILSGHYDDIFNKILLWRTYYKEPFHNYRYGLNIRSVDDYMGLYLTEELNNFFSSNNFRLKWKAAVRFFAKKGNMDNFIQHEKKKEIKQKIERQVREEREVIEKEIMNKKLEEEKKERIRKQEESRIKKLESAKSGQKQKTVTLEMIDGKVYKNATSAGNRASWLCPCGAKAPLIGRTYGIIPQSDSVVVCKKCNNHYYLYPSNGKPNKPPEKIIEISEDYDFSK